MRYAIKGRMWWGPVLRMLASLVGWGIAITVAAVIGALVIAAFISSLKTF
jgi:hypothetical protein